MVPADDVDETACWTSCEIWGKREMLLGEVLVIRGMAEGNVSTGEDARSTAYAVVQSPTQIAV